MSLTSDRPLRAWKESKRKGSPAPGIQIVGLEPTALFPRREGDGPLAQVAFLKLRSSEEREREATIRVAIGGRELEPTEARIAPGDSRIRLEIPDIESPLPIRVRVVQAQAGSASPAAWSGLWQPQRKWKVYLVKASHYDLGYDGRMDVMQNDAAEYIDLAKRLCTDRDQHHEWHYHLEHMRFVRAYEAERSEAALRDLVENYLKKGAMTLLGNPGGPHFHWMDYEQLARASYPARREMADRFGLDVRTISVVDNPSASWPAYQLFAQAGFKYLLRFGQPFRGPGSLQELKAPVVAWVEGPNGKDRILCSFHDTYGEPLWLGDGGTLGAPLIEEAAGRLSSHLLGLQAGERGAYPYDAVIVPNYVDWEVPNENERVLAQWRETFRYPELHWSDASAALAHIEAHHGDKIPVIRGDTNNNSGDYSSIDPRSQGLKRRTTRLLAFAEGLDALAAAADGAHPHPGREFNGHYIDLAEYDEHCWPTMLEATDVNIFNTYVAKPAAVQRVARKVGESLRRSMRTLAGADGAPGMTVWNSLGHPRSGLVEVEAVAGADAPGSLVDAVTGEALAVQAAPGGGWRFVAGEIPAYGYRRFDLRSDSVPAPAGEEDGFDIVDNEETLSLANAWYRITFDKRLGRVTGLYSFPLQRELLDPAAPHGFNQWLRCHTAPFSYSASPKELEISPIGRSTGRVGERGPVSASLEVATLDEALGVEITTRYVLYGRLDHLDVANDVRRADFLHTPAALRYTENVFVCFPFQVPDPRFRVEYGPGVLDPASDLFASNTDFVVANRWVDVSGGEFGVTLVPHEAAAVHLGQINYNQFRSEFEASTSHLYSYAWSNRMAGLIALGPDDFQATLSYSIRAHAGDWRQGEAPAFGWRQASPLLAFPETGNAAPERSFLSIGNPDVQATVFKRAEQPGGGYIVRLAEVGGLDHAAVPVSFDIGPLSRAHLCDPVENDLRELPVEAGRIVLPLGRHDLATVRLCLEAPVLPEIAGLEARAAGDSSVELTWQASSQTGYHVYRSEDPDAPATLHSLIGYAEEPSYRDTGLKPGALYVYRVAAATRHNLQGPVSAPVSARTTLENRTPPAPVADLGVVPFDHDRLGVYWRRSPEPDLALYRLHRSRLPDFTATDATFVADIAPTRYAYLVHPDTDVRMGELWYYRVFPVDYAGNVQPASDCVSGRTPTAARFPSRRYA